MVEELRAEAEDLSSEMVDLRRAIHRRPELGLDNPETQARILSALDGLGMELETGRGLSSVVATLRGSRPGPTLLLRADTDALPMSEDTDWAHRSEIPDRAHVCGHDAHVAMLVGAARILAARGEDLVGTVRFMFQPGEEGSGGAAVMLSEGLLAEGLDRPVDGAFALHVSPNIPVGVVAGRAGPVMAATDDFWVSVKGRGAHASTPHFGNDPIPVACEMVTALQTFVTRRIDAFNPAVVTVGQIHGGTTTNVIPEVVRFSGTIRTVSEWARAAAVQGLRRVVEGVAAAHGCEVEVETRSGYPVTVNDAPFHEFASGVVREVFGPDGYFELPSPVMGAEDFSYVLAEVPGSMLFLGVCPEDIPNSLEAPSCHSNLMRCNEDALAGGAALHAAVALRFLERGLDPG